MAAGSGAGGLPEVLSSFLSDIRAFSTVAFSMLFLAEVQVSVRHEDKMPEVNIPMACPGNCNGLLKSRALDLD